MPSSRSSSESARKTSKRKTATKKPPTKKKSPTKKARKAQLDEFHGFPKELFKFLAELEKNNERDWFQANKARYEEVVKAPLESFVADVEPEVGPGKVFRIYRDVRFSKDKSPYKTHASAVFEKKGLVFYLHLEKDHIFCATGMYQMARDQLNRFYEAVVDTRAGAKLAKLVDAAEELELEIGGEALKSAARGYPKDHPRVRFLRHKGLTISRTWKPIRKWAHTPEIAERVLEAWRQSADLNAWLQKHVGPSDSGNRFVSR